MENRLKSNMLRVDNCSSHCTTPSERNAQRNNMVAVKVGCLHINLATGSDSEQYLSECSEAPVEVPKKKISKRKATEPSAAASSKKKSSGDRGKACQATNGTGTSTLKREGQRAFLLQMLVLCFVPHAALVIQNCTVMAQLSHTLDSLLFLDNEVITSLTIGEAISSIQDERLAVFKYLLNNSSQEDYERAKLENIFLVSSSNLANFPIQLTHLEKKLYHFREDVISLPASKNGEILKNIPVYEEINSVLLIYLVTHVNSRKSSLWRVLSACYHILEAKEETSLSSLQWTAFSKNKSHYLKDFISYIKHQTSAEEHLESTILYFNAEGLALAKSSEKILKAYKKSNSFRDDIVLKDEGISKEDFINLKSSNEMEVLQTNLAKLTVLQQDLWIAVRDLAGKEVWVAKRTLCIGVLILTVVLLASPVLVLLIRHTASTIRTFAKSIEQSTQQILAEKQKSDLLLSRMLPPTVLRRLRAQRAVPAESYDAVTIFFSDIVGFTNISSTSTPMEVINMLNMLYRLFDKKIQNYNVYKVETIGDAYMVVSGLPQRNGNRHASEIADMSLSLMRSLEGATVPHRPDEPLRVRAGINTGPCVAGVVGTTMPRYCLFGDTINVASRMESTGEAMKIHISMSTKKALDFIGGYEMESRGIRDIAGKGEMETFWLQAKKGGIPDDQPSSTKFLDYEGNILELIINN